jgi:hypothetical protein
LGDVGCFKTNAASGEFIHVRREDAFLAVAAQISSKIVGGDEEQIRTLLALAKRREADREAGREASRETRGR